MENGVSSNYGSDTRSFASRETAVFNTKYAAILSDGEIHIVRLEHLDKQPQHLPCPRTSGWAPCTLALSAIWPDILAASIGSMTYVFDLDRLSHKHFLPGTGRTVTSIAFPDLGTNSVITGHIDGSICLWDLHAPDKPIRRLVGAGGPCKVISSSQIDSNLLASVHNGKLHVWRLERDASQQICSLEDTRVEAFAWHPRIAGRLALSNANGEIKLCQLPDTIKDAHGLQAPDFVDEESDNEIFGEPDGVRKGLRVLSTLEARTRIRFFSWVGEESLLGLGQNGEYAFLYEVETNAYELVEVWSCKFEKSSYAANMVNVRGETTLMAIANDGIECPKIPSSIASKIHRDVRHTRDASKAAVGPYENEASESLVPVLESPATEPKIERMSPTVAPQSISEQRAEASAFKRTSSQLQQKRRSSRWRYGTKNSATRDLLEPESREPSTPPRTYDSELSITPDAEDLDHPMPFLSPTIPARKVSPNSISALDENVMRPPQLPSSSFESSIPSTAPVLFDDQDSDDSDDETFVDDMQGSAAYLPGGINVPLPKACGALFAPNGQLLTFFPPKPRPVSVRKEFKDEPQEKRREGSKTARLFPTFGNLQSDFDSLIEYSDSEDSSFIEGDTIDGGELPRFSFQPASFPSQLSWKPQDVAVNPIYGSQGNQYRIIVNVHEVLDVAALHPVQRALANGYRLLCNTGESGAELCNHNAVVAAQAGSVEVAEVWRFLAMLLDDQVPLELLSIDSLAEDVLIIARRASLLNLNTPISTLAKPATYSGKLRWCDHPFGGAWLVRRVLDWAEQCADIQSLACMSAVLSEVEGQISTEYPTVQQTFLTHLPMYSLDYVSDTIRNTSTQKTNFGVPMLRCHAATITSLHESPTKVLRLSSQSSITYPDSGSTPPFSLPSISRQSTRLSVSGSVSPEFQRGSFTAAAKYYGQAITDKFSSYGTSPPFKKTDTSPSMNTELSSSLPSGSWPGKSVSFASTTTDDTHPRSFSVSAYRATRDDEGYDSDKTIEDSSLPHTPRSPGNTLVLNMNNQDVFADEISGYAKTKLVPKDLADRVPVWNQYYAELLRSWNMPLRATELEKVTGLACGTLPQSGNADLTDAGIIPAAASPRRKAVCNVCFTATKGIMQTCTSCLHSSHLGCLEEYSADLVEEEFTCPSGCGCQCSDLPYVVQNPSASPQRPTFKKKPSFTDPRRWRAKVEGDTW